MVLIYILFFRHRNLVVKSHATILSISRFNVRSFHSQQMQWLLGKTHWFNLYIYTLQRLVLTLSFHLQNRNKVLKLIKDTIAKRQASPETGRVDFLDHLIDGMKANNLYTDTLVAYVIFALLLATSETIPSTLTIAIKFLTENPLVMQELVVTEATTNIIISSFLLAFFFFQRKKSLCDLFSIYFFILTELIHGYMF